MQEPLGACPAHALRAEPQSATSVTGSTKTVPIVSDQINLKILQGKKKHPLGAFPIFICSFVFT